MTPVKTIKLLYVEDDPYVADTMITMLERIRCQNFSIEHVGNLQSSIDYLTSVDCNVDAVLLDLVLPDSSGIDTFLKVYNHCVKVPIIIVSAHEDIAIQCIKLGAQDYLVKPDIPPKLLSRSIKYAIERKKIYDKYKEIVEVTGAVIYEIDFRTNKFTYVNDQMTKLSGYSREEFMNMSAADILTERSMNEFIQRLQDIKEGKPTTCTHEYELRIKDGTIKWALITAKFKQDENGDIIGANVVAIDVTDKKLAEEEAKRKEEIIYNKLENKIRRWQRQIKTDTVITHQKLQVISDDILSMSNEGL